MCVCVCVQGWLNAAQTRLVMDDEKDEQSYATVGTRTTTFPMHWGRVPAWALIVPDEPATTMGSG